METILHRLGSRVLVAVPPRESEPAKGLRVHPICGDAYENIISDIQRFRGSVYIADKAIPASALDVEGRDYTEFDFSSWHFVIRKCDGSLCGTIRMRYHSPRTHITDLRLYGCLSRVPFEHRNKFIEAVRNFREAASSDSLLFGEVGGWAVSPEFRTSSAALLLPIAGWAMCQILGHAFILGAATMRHTSPLRFSEGLVGFP